MLTGTNTYTGGNVVSGGTLRIPVGENLGSTTGQLTVNGTGILDFGTTTQTVGAITLGGSGTIQNGTLNGTSITATGGTVTAPLFISGAIR